MTYAIEISSRARRGIRRISREDQRRVSKAIDGLADEPRPDGVAKMRGFDRRYRIRIGDYRVIYDIYDDRLLVVVVEAGHRREIYR